MKRAAIYARYSTDQQDDRSIDGQYSLCRDYAKAQGFTVTEEYCDRAKSSGSMLGRDGLVKMMEDAKAGQFDGVICEHVDRLSRNSGDLSYIFEQLTFRQIPVITVSGGGVMNDFEAAIHGVMGGQHLKAGREKTRRGLAENIRRGRSAGGKAYGYRPVPGQIGILEIVAEEAGIIQRIFREYLDGVTPRNIAGGLNRDGIAAPRGGSWNASTINGNGERGCGILRNPLYAGRMAWNRVTMVRHPDTKRRISRVNAKEAWQSHDHPDLAIIDQATFDAVAKRKADESRAYASGLRNPRNHHLLSGLLRCGSCGSGMSSVGFDHGRQRVRCSKSKESGSCENRRPHYLDEIIAAVVINLRDWLDNTGAMEAYVESYQAEWKALNRKAVRERDRVQRRVMEVEGELTRLVEATAKDTLPRDIIESRAKPLMIERVQLRASLARAEEAVPKIALHPKAVRSYHASMEHLAVNLSAVRGDNPEAFAAVQRLIAEVIVHPGDPSTVTVNGRILALTKHEKTTQSATGIGMVAGARYQRFPDHAIASRLETLLCRGVVSCCDLIFSRAYETASTCAISRPD